MDKTLYNVAVEVDACATMRDGTILRADIYRPLGDALFPVLLMRLPYEKACALTNLYAHPQWYASHGYVVVVQDCRGRWRSDGEFIPFVNEVNDGADSVAWASRLSGTTGRVGMYGASYVGATQLQAAIGAGEAVTCMCPAVTLASRYDGYYEGGAFQLAFASYWAMSIVPDIARRKGRADVFRGIAAAMGDPRSSYAHLPVRDFPPLRDTGLAPFFFEWLTHPTHDDYWRDGDIYPLYERIKTPALHIGGWYDTFLTGTLRNYRGISDVGGSGASGRQRLLIGPWIHSPWVRCVGDVDFGPAGESNFVDDLQLRYFNWILKGRTMASAQRRQSRSS